MRRLVALFVALATMTFGGVARGEDLPPLVFSEEEIEGICESYHTGNELHALRSMVEVKYGLDRYYAAYDQLICGAKRMPPIYHAIHLGPMQTHIRYELAALAALPDAKRRQIVESCYIHRGYGSTMIDMVDRHIRSMEAYKEANSVELPDDEDDPGYARAWVVNKAAATPLRLYNEYRDALVAMGAVRFHDLTADQQARC